MIGLKDNPLYEYLIDLQIKRVHLLDTLAPRRHAAMQTWLMLSFLAIFLLVIFSESLGGLAISVLVLLGPFILFVSLFLAGMNSQMIALQNYPSPLDSPQALEMLLSTPLTEKEIVSATIAASVRYPFIGSYPWRVLSIAGNFALMAVIVYVAYIKKILPVDILFISLGFYLPAFCVFIFFPLLSALDQLMVPSGWLQKNLFNESRPAEKRFGRSGRLPSIAMSAVLIPVIIYINHSGYTQISTLQWVIFRACPITIISLVLFIAVLTSLLPGHLAALRRGE